MYSSILSTHCFDSFPSISFLFFLFIIEFISTLQVYILTNIQIFIFSLFFIVLYFIFSNLSQHSSVLSIQFTSLMLQFNLITFFHSFIQFFIFQLIFLLLFLQLTFHKHFYSFYSNIYHYLHFIPQLTLMFQISYVSPMVSERTRPLFSIFGLNSDLNVNTFFPKLNQSYQLLYLRLHLLYGKNISIIMLNKRLEVTEWLCLYFCEGLILMKYFFFLLKESLQLFLKRIPI